MNMSMLKMLNVCVGLYISIAIILLTCVLIYWLIYWGYDSKDNMVFLMAIVIFWPLYVIKFALRFVVKVLNRFIEDMIHL